jgi:hypothetical protein
MHISVAVLLGLALAAAAPADTVPADRAAAPWPPAATDAYLDPAARELVLTARARRQGAEGSLTRYRNLARSRVSVGLDARLRERLFYRCESAVRVDWQRGSPTRVDVLGAREVTPMFGGRVRPERSDCVGAVFDPADDRLTLATFGLLRADSGSVRHPLGAGSESDYRFRGGDTTTLRLPDGRTLRLHELQVIPRRSDPRLVSGSLWLDEESRAVVRAVLRLARSFDLERDTDDGRDVPALFRPMRAELRFLTIEYGLWEGRWWLPRLIAYQGELSAGGLLKMPITVEQRYTDYEVWGADVPPLEAGERLAAAARTCPTPTRRSGESRPERRSVTINLGTGGAGLDAQLTSGCTCSGGRCWEIDTVVPTDSTVLLTSELLPPSIFQEGQALLTAGEREELLRQLRLAPSPPWQMAAPTVRWGWQGLDLLRYNRVEGLSVAATAELDLGRGTLDATARLGTGDRVPGAELGLTRRGVDRSLRVAAYHRLETVRPENRALGPGNSLAALLLGRDDGDYYRAGGAELWLRTAAGSRGLSARLFAQQERAAAATTDLALPGLWRDQEFRPNLAAEGATQFGGALSWRATRGLNPAGVRGALSLGLEGAAGTFAYAQPRGTAALHLPLAAGLLLAAEGGGGITLGEPAPQHLWHLGGPATVRGYGGAAGVGEGFWRARGEIGRATPGARLVLFSDLARAYGPAGEGAGELLGAVGVGASFLDGLVRLDLAAPRHGRPRVDLHLNAPL